MAHLLHAFLQQCVFVVETDDFYVCFVVYYVIGEVKGVEKQNVDNSECQINQRLTN